MRIDQCPRCGAPGYLVEDTRIWRKKNGEETVQTYIYVLHRYRDPVTGRTITKKCSVGSEEYIYVTRTHNLPAYGIILKLSNIIEAEKIINLAEKTLENLEKYIRKLDPEKKQQELLKIDAGISAIIERATRIQKIIREMVPKFGNNEKNQP